MSRYRRSDIQVEIFFNGPWGFLRCGRLSSAPLMARFSPDHPQDVRERMVESLLGERLKDSLRSLVLEAGEVLNPLQLDSAKEAGDLLIALGQVVKVLIQERETRVAEKRSVWG